MTSSGSADRPGGPAWRQSIFHPFALTALHARGVVLRPQLDAPTMETTVHGTVSALDLVATWEAESGQLAVFVVNRHPDEEIELAVPLQVFGRGSLRVAKTLADADRFACNTEQEPDRVRPSDHDSACVHEGVLRAVLPAASWSMFLVDVV